MITPPEDLQKLSLGQLLAQVSRLVGGRMREKMEELGLQRAQGLILVQLWHNDGIPQNELAQAMHITPATVTKTLQRMERNGWIARRRDASDQRIMRVYLTERAHALHEEVRSSFHELDSEMSSALTDEECALLHQSLLKVRRHLSPDGAHGYGALSLRGASTSKDREGSR